MPSNVIPLKLVHLIMKSNKRWFLFHEYVLRRSMWSFSLILTFSLNFYVNGSLARNDIKDLIARASIRMIYTHSSQQIYTRATTNTQSAFYSECLCGSFLSYFLNWTYKLESIVQMCNHSLFGSIYILAIRMGSTTVKLHLVIINN